MSWYSDGVAGWYSTIMNGAKFLNEHNPISPGIHSNAVSDFFESESQKADLRGAEITGFLGGLPVIGNLVKGIEGISQMEDLYRNTGKVVQYPSLSGAGATSLGKGVGSLARKIEDGTHDLFEHYSGTKDDTIESLHEKGIMKYGDEI